MGKLRLLLVLNLILQTLHLSHGQVGDAILIIHGGAGTISPDHGNAKKSVMIDAIRAGYAALEGSDDAQGAVEAAIRVMEDSPAFNAGTGSVLTASGEIEMDAILINGTDLSTGAIGAVRHIKNPITLAKLVKDGSDHVFMVGDQAELFALNSGVILVPTSSLKGNWNESGARNEVTDHFHRSKRSSDWDVGTVGAVAINGRGQIFAGTSTGGLSGKLEGRVGDAPLVGCGTLADDLIAGISGTGWGEAFIRYRVASRIASLIETGTNATVAINAVLSGMASRIPEADGGAIVITKDREIGYGWNSEQMAWAWSRGSDIHYGVDIGEDLIVPLHPGEISTNMSPSTEVGTSTVGPSSGVGHSGDLLLVLGLGFMLTLRK